MADMVLSAVADAAKNSYEKIEGEVEGLSRMVGRIRARLDDAEEWGTRDESIRLWLRELEGVLYDAEDVMEEARLQMEGCGFPGTTGEMVLLRIEEIRSRFLQISESKVTLGSDEWRRVGSEIPARPQTTSLMKEFCVVGRENDLKIVKNFLLSDAGSGRSNNTSVMAIVGMGGIGKTTLAQLAYNDDEVGMKFDLKSWICVSEDFDLLRLTRDMIESFTREASHLRHLDTLQIKLKEILAGKRLLLVLDDVWEKEGHLLHNWDRLMLPLQLNSSGGCKILLTTRSEEVSRIAGAVLTHHLPSLRGEDCLQVFSQRAFEGRDLAVLHPELKDLGEEISKRCGGVPLVAEILGCQLRWVDEAQKWKEILEGDIWDIDRKGIMPVLKLSYDFLPAHLKRCFRYCSVFPKDYIFDKDRLVRMWMAHDYVKPRGALPLEDIGMSYFDELLWRSFFHCSLFGEVLRMHDLIHDLARYVSSDTCRSLEDGKPYNKSGRDVRHISMICRGHPTDAIRKIQLPVTLRSLVFINNSQGRANNMEYVTNVCTITRYLRVLDLSGSGIEHLPNSISCLKLLRYLGLPDCLRKSICHEQPLQLPDSISKLLNLRHLIYKYDVTYPVGIGKLTNLQTMPCFHVAQDSSHANLGELKDINNIQSLHISGMSGSTSVGEAKMACLDKKEHLRDLHLEWSHPSSLGDEVLESLKPNLTLESLQITRFMGRPLPSWLGHPSFSKLSNLQLTRCYNWASLPCLGQLPSLKHLSIYYAPAVEFIGREFFLGGFPRLESLRLESMYKLRSCCGVEKGECPRLIELVICDCSCLQSFSLINKLHPTLQKLRIEGCSFLEKWCQEHNRQILTIPMLNVRGIDKHHMTLKNVLSVQEAREANLRALERLRTLELVWDGDGSLRFSTAEELEDVLENLLPHNNLRKLVICGYIGSRTATWLGDPSFSNLLHVTLQCSQFVLLPPLGQLPRLQELYIKGAHSLERIGNEFFVGDNYCSSRLHCAFPSLINLEFQDLPIWEEWVRTEDGDLPSLNKLTITHCPRLNALPNLPQLKELELGATEQLMFPASLINLLSLQSLHISDLPNLRQLPQLPDHLLALTLKNLPAVCNLQIPPSVRDLTLEGCHERALIGLLPCLTNLTSLRISQLPEFTQPLPLHNLVALQKLDISGCPKLESLDCLYFSPLSEIHEDGLQALGSLRSLSLKDCPELNFSASDRLPSALRYLALTHCPKIVPWCNKDLRRLAHLHEIWVDGIRVSGEKGDSIRSQIEKKDGAYVLRNCSVSHYHRKWL